MKLRIAKEAKAVVLIAGETLTAQHSPVLKSGIMKLFQANHRTIIIEFENIDNKQLATPENLRCLAELHTWAHSQSGNILVVGGFTAGLTLGAPSFLTRQDALASLSIAGGAPGQNQTSGAVTSAGAPGTPAVNTAGLSTIDKLLLVESKLKNQFDVLSAQKKELETKINSPNFNAIDIKTLQKANSDLRTRIVSLEKNINSHMKTRADPFHTETIIKKHKELLEILLPALEHENILQKPQAGK